MGENFTQMKWLDNYIGLRGSISPSLHTVTVHPLGVLVFTSHSPGVHIVLLTHYEFVFVFTIGPLVVHAVLSVY